MYKTIQLDSVDKVPSGEVLGERHICHLIKDLHHTGLYSHRCAEYRTQPSPVAAQAMLLHVVQWGHKDVMLSWTQHGHFAIHGSPYLT